MEPHLAVGLVARCGRSVFFPQVFSPRRRLYGSPGPFRARRLLTLIYKMKHQILDVFTTILSVLQPSWGGKSFERRLSPSSSEI